MLGDYILHFPLTDFAVSLLAVAALIDVARLVLKRGAWTTTVDLLLVAGFLGALAAVGSGLWLVSAQVHIHDDLLSVHHWFAYGTLAAASASVIARLLQKRSPAFAAIKTTALVLSALLVSGAGFYGGRMAHPAGETTDHDAVPHIDSVPHGNAAPHEGMTSTQHGAMPPADAPTAGSPSSATPVPADATSAPARADAAKPAHNSTPHSH